VEPGKHTCDRLHATITLGVAHWNPAGHMLVFVEFCGQYCDALQGVITSGVSHIDPAGQGWGVTEPFKQRLPSSHGIKVDGVGQKKDAGHRSAWVVPGRHVCV